jgi:acyl-coenzyme A synthetase/AMP-(fatty) acid ligase
MISAFYNKLYESFRTSGSIFYKYYSEEYSYKKLFTNLEKLNFHLSAYKNKRVVLYGAKTFEVYSAIYSIIMSGNTWAPLNLSFPLNLQLEILDVLEADIILYDENLPEEIESYAKKENIIIWDLCNLLQQSSAKSFDGFDFSPDDIAYIMFTSGSTGTPKGVLVTHQNYINFINNVMEILPFKMGEVFSDYHDFAFDISIFYLFCTPLMESSISPIRSDDERIYPVNHIRENKITVWSSVPSVVSRMQRLRPKEKIETPIRIMFLCGEPFSLDVLKYCYDNLELEYVFNFYGLTETGVENFYHKCSNDDLKKFEEKGFVPIGKPMKGSNVHLTDGKELLLGGCQITPGYLGGIRSERFEIIEKERWYHTGDIVELYNDVYFCKGRLDTQVKLSGYRVELMDIEVQVKKYLGIKEAVSFVDNSNLSKFLVCALESEEPVDLKLLKGELKNYLPDYMIPLKFFFVDEMPRNSNGKLDRKEIRDNIWKQRQIRADGHK